MKAGKTDGLSDEERAQEKHLRTLEQLDGKLKARRRGQGFRSVRKRLQRARDEAWAQYAAIKLAEE